MATRITPEQRKAVLELIQAIAETIKELGSVPAGHLYARLMDKMSIETFQTIVDTLVKAKIIENKGFLLTYIGPR